MFPWILLSVFCVCQAYRKAVMCYGSDSVFPSNRFLHSFGRVYFTPTSPDLPRRLVMDKYEIKDSRYQLLSTGSMKLLDVTERDDGKYTVLNTRSNETYTFLTVTVKDCDNIKKVALQYGNRFAFVLPGDQFELAFSPPDSPFQQVVLWNGTEAGVKGRGRKRDGSWELQELTQADSGYYTIRNSKGKFISRTGLTITEHVESCTKDTDEVFRFTYHLNPVLFTVTYTPEGEYAQPIEVMKWGHLKGNFFSGRFTWEQDPFSHEYRIQISELELGDSGRFEFRDQNANLALVVELEVNGEEPSNHLYYMWLKPVFTLIAVVACSYCVKKCCCNGNPSDPDSSANTPEQTVIYHPNTCQPAASNHIQPSGPSYSSQPAAPTYPSQPSGVSYPSQPSGVNYPSQPSAASGYQGPPAYSLVLDSDETTANVPFPVFHHVKQVKSSTQVSAVGGEGSAPSFPLGLSSDSGTQFELPKGINYPSTPLLSSDTPDYVYTSDKMNFL